MQFRAINSKITHESDMNQKLLDRFGFIVIDIGSKRLDPFNKKVEVS